jgi:hypothetical protein
VGAVDAGDAEGVSAAVDGGGLPCGGKLLPPDLPPDGFEGSLLRPGFPDSSFSVPAKSEAPEAARPAGALLGCSVSLAAAVLAADAMGALKARMVAFIRRNQQATCQPAAPPCLDAPLRERVERIHEVVNHVRMGVFLPAAGLGI